MPSAAVVICAYTTERWDLLTKGIDAVLAQTHPPDRTIVVIDHNEELFALVAERFGHRVNVIQNAERKGLSGARNTGVAAAQEEVIAFIDDDAVPEPDWLAALLSSYDKDVLGVGGQIRPTWESRRPKWFPREFDWVVGCTYLGMPETTSPVRNLIGANMSLRRSVFDRVGGFAYELGHRGKVPFGCEETELCIRAHQSLPEGMITYEPSARVNHWVSDERAEFAYFRKRCFAEGGGKALMTGLVGSGDGLSSERAYTLRVLPVGVLNGVLSSVKSRRSDGLLQAAAIVAGLAIVACGYVLGRIRA